jgi:hypothetical protein
LFKPLKALFSTCHNDIASISNCPAAARLRYSPSLDWLSGAFTNARAKLLSPAIFLGFDYSSDVDKRK